MRHPVENYIYATRSLYASSDPGAEGIPSINQSGRGSGSYLLRKGSEKSESATLYESFFTMAEKDRAQDR